MGPQGLQKAPFFNSRSSVAPFSQNRLLGTKSVKNDKSQPPGGYCLHFGVKKGLVFRGQNAPKITTIPKMEPWASEMSPRAPGLPQGSQNGSQNGASGHPKSQKNKKSDHSKKAQCNALQSHCKTAPTGTVAGHARSALDNKSYKRRARPCKALLQEGPTGPHC